MICHGLCHVSWYFQVVNNLIFQIQRFLRVGPTLGGGVEPGRADGAWPSQRPAQPAPGPAGDIFKITGPSPTRSVRFQSYATSARLGQRVSNLTGRLPGLACEIRRILSPFFRDVSLPRGFKAATCSLARAPRLLRGVARLYNERTKPSLP